MSSFDAAAIVLSGRRIKMRRGRAGSVFELDENLIKMSETMSQFFSNSPDFDKDSEVFEVDEDRFSSDDVLEKIIEFMKQYAQEPFGELPKPFPKDQGMAPVGPAWAKRYFEKKTLKDCMSVLKGAHMLDIKPLLQLCAAFIAIQIHNKNYDQICETAGVWKDNYHKWVPNTPSDAPLAGSTSSSSAGGGGVTSSSTSASGDLAADGGQWIKCDRLDPAARIDFSPIEAIRNEYKSPGDIFFFDK